MKRIKICYSVEDIQCGNCQVVSRQLLGRCGCLFARFMRAQLGTIKLVERSVNLLLQFLSVDVLRNQ